MFFIYIFTFLIIALLAIFVYFVFSKVFLYVKKQNKKSEIENAVMEKRNKEIFEKYFSNQGEKNE